MPPHPGFAEPASSSVGDAPREAAGHPAARRRPAPGLVPAERGGRAGAEYRVVVTAESDSALFARAMATACVAARVTSSGVTYVEAANPHAPPAMSRIPYP